MKRHFLDDNIKFYADVPFANRNMYTYLWEFSDGEKYYDYMFTRTFKKFGIYDVKLTTTNKNSGLAGIKTIKINIVPYHGGYVYNDKKTPMLFSWCGVSYLDPVYNINIDSNNGSGDT